MPAKPLRHRRGRLACRVVPVAALLVAAAVPCDPAAAQLVAPTLGVAGDSVIVGSPPVGQLTIRVTRPDAVTGRPVVIGQYAGAAESSLPFTVNTTNPTAQDPDGDCWQAGALSQPLTPDIRPGDTVTMTGEPGPFGTAIPPMSVTADGSGGDGGPIPECRSIAPFAQNAATAAPASVTGGPIDVSGVAQPLASGVSTSVSDGTHSTPPVDVTPKSDGTWSATVPGDQVDKLSDGSLTVRPVFAVPDVTTGATAHVAGAPISVRMTRSGGPAGGSPAAGLASPSPPASEGGRAAGAAPLLVSKLAVRSAMSLARARRDGLSASFVVPEGAQVVDVRLLRGGRSVLGRRTRAGKAGARQTVRLRGPALRTVLRRGRYTLAVRAGASGDQLGTAVQRTIRVR